MKSEESYRKENQTMHRDNREPLTFFLFDELPTETRRDDIIELPICSRASFGSGNCSKTPKKVPRQSSKLSALILCTARGQMLPRLWLTAVARDTRSSTSTALKSSKNDATTGAIGTRLSTGKSQCLTALVWSETI
jgi:hypothetical protein